jgi:iron complex outermembrane receptor protein
VLRFGNPDANQATITLSAEQGVFRGTSLSTQTAPPTTRTPTTGAVRVSAKQVVTWQNSTGFTTQANASFDNTFFVTGGVRLERDSRLPGSKTAALPMLGTAAVRDYGPFTVKLRAAYGQGIRPPTTFGHTEFWQNSWTSTTQPELGPEKQSGTEVGLDILLRRNWSLRVTRFDQRASGLIQQVALPADSNPATRRMRYELENVGEIANNGWEMESSANVARLSVSGTLTFVHSKVEKVAKGYRGDLLAGDRMLQVPARTGSVNLSWLGDRWLTSVSASRALDWINYDELGLATAYLSGTRTAHDLLGQQLRQYWRRYNGGLHVRATASRDVRNMFTFEVTGDNLLNYQRNEPDNMTVTPGRTLMTGVRLRF